MNNLRSIMLTVIVILSAFTIVTYTACTKDPCEGISCTNGGVCNVGTCVCPDGYTGQYCETKKDPCDDVVCHNGGVCVAGKCTCQTGYEGEYCEVLSRAKFIGTWTGADVCTGTTYNITMQLVTATKETEVSLINPGGFGSNVKITGVMSAVNEITFTNQDVGNGIVLNGVIKLSGNTLTFTYTIIDANNSSDSCTGTYTKQ